MVSPLHPYAGPPHSYSNHQSSGANTLPGSLGGLLSPPESRRTSGDEKEQRGPTRQSLPSIHEALGAEQPLSYPGPPPSAPVSAPQQYHPSSTTVSPSDTRSRNFSTDLHASQGPSNPFSHPHPRSPFIGTSAVAAPPPPPPQSQPDSLPRPSFSEPRPSFASPRPSFSDPRPSLSDPRSRPTFPDQRPPFPEPRNSYSGSQHNSKLPTLHPIQTTQSPPPGPRPQLPYTSYPPQPSSAYESSTPHSAGPMNPNYGYSQYPPNYPLSAPGPSGPSSGYPPPASTYSAPPRYPPPSWGSDNAEMARMEEKKIGRSSLAPYGESVKRHLESFDLEASLNEVCIFGHDLHVYVANNYRWQKARDASRTFPRSTDNERTRTSGLA
jgi:glutamate--cysteine ligase catalytic subunit